VVAPASGLLALQRAAGNRAVSGVVQRVVQKPNKTVLNPKASHQKWAALTPQKRTQAYRMMNDFYRVYRFTDANHFYNYLAGLGPPPLKVKEYWRRQANPTATGTATGAKDPFFEEHDVEAAGGFGVTDKTVGLGGAPRHVFLETKKHASNWASFVELHHEGVVKRLQDAGKYKGKTQARIEALYAECLQHADVMDQQEVGSGDTLVMSTDGAVWSAVRIEQAVNKMWKRVAKRLGQPRGVYAQAVLPRWGQLHQGMGTSVGVVFRGDVKQSIVAGSKAETAQFMPPWLEELRQRITMEAKSQYIEGHLLNDHLGGTATAYNIVPLTEQANHAHLNLVETHVKLKVLQMLDEQALGRHGKSPVFDPISRVEYRVEADYAGWHQRANTKKWIDVYNFLKAVIALLPTVKAKYTGAMKVKKFHDKLLGGSFMPHVVNGHLLNYADTWGVLQEAMNVVAWDRNATTLEEALDRIDVISDVWLAEEKYAPVALDCNAKTVRASGDEDDDGKVTGVRIPNQIGLIRFAAPVRE